MNNIPFIGFWKLIEADPSPDLGDGDEMEFKENGELIYAIDPGSKWQVMNLIFKIEGNYLIMTNLRHQMKKELYSILKVMIYWFWITKA